MSLSGADIPRPSEIKTYHIKPYDRIAPEKSGFKGKGKTVFVTGGSGGIGYSIVRAFAAAGASRIIINSRSPDSQAKAKTKLNASYPDVQVETVAADIVDLDTLTAALKSAGPIDVLVLNAYYSHQLNVPSSTIPASEIGKTFQANVVANWHLIQTYLESTPKPVSGEKTVIAVSSAAAHIDVPMNIGYATSKAALSRMIALLANEYTPEKDGVRLMNYHPGIIRTEGATAQGFPEEGPVWEDVDLSGDFAVWLASKESEFLHGRLVWAQWSIDDLLAQKERVKKDSSFLKIALVY